ncbi:hypothetical protein PMAYCL1PPCAC_10741, partial [Pristionchus mayeri]
DIMAHRSVSLSWFSFVLIIGCVQHIYCIRFGDAGTANIMSQDKLRGKGTGALENRNGNVFMDFPTGALTRIVRSDDIKQPNSTVPPVSDNHIILQLVIVCLFVVLLFTLIRCVLYCMRLYDERRLYQR